MSEQARIDFLNWLSEREQWLTKEAHSGGDWQHLNTRRQELAYIRERFTKLAAA